VERDIIREKMKDNLKRNPIEVVFFMQHYGEATRFCDLTISPLSALFFASEGETDGAVFVVRKDSVISVRSPEMGLFSQVLFHDIENTSEIETDANLSLDVNKILSQNHVVDYKNLGYSNPRAFRQGGTGILFGFGVEGSIISQSGNVDVGELIITKLVIDETAKTKILIELRKLGYFKEALFDIIGEIHEPDQVFMTQTSFFTERRFDKEGCFNKIIAKYRVNTLQHNRDDLAIQINNLYAKLFTQYGENARIGIFFYFDENDVFIANWICRGLWSKETQYEIRWNNDYQADCLNRLNEQISSETAINSMASLVNELTPAYRKLLAYISQPDYDLKTLFALLQDIQPYVKKRCDDAGSIPYTDFEHQRIPESAWSFISNFDRLIGEMLMFSKRLDMKEQTIRWMLQTYINDCEKPKNEYEKLIT